jgi:hypothetical protein
MPLQVLLLLGVFLGGVAGKPREGQQHLEELAYVVSGTINDFNPSALPGGVRLTPPPWSNQPSRLVILHPLPSHRPCLHNSRRWTTFCSHHREEQHTFAWDTGLHSPHFLPDRFRLRSTKLRRPPQPQGMRVQPPKRGVPIGSVRAVPRIMLRRHPQDPGI